MKRNSNGISARVLVMAVALTLIIGGIIGGSVAWLTAKTDSVVNTFTVGDINITLDESENLDLKMVPGKTITKDPKVTVTGGSETCWLFVKVEKSNNLNDFISYSIATGWIELENENGVYYREVAASDKNQSFDVISGNSVTVNTTVTKTMLNGLADATKPTLTFTAYAVQKDNIADASTAWSKLFPSTNP